MLPYFFVHKIPTHRPDSVDSPPQILLFSATYNDRIKRFAQKIVPAANQVRRRGRRRGRQWALAAAPEAALQQFPSRRCRLRSGALGSGPVQHATGGALNRLLCCQLQVFVPKEELSLDVIKQYRVVGSTGQYRAAAPARAALLGSRPGPLARCAPPPLGSGPRLVHAWGGTPRFLSLPLAGRPASTHACPFPFPAAALVTPRAVLPHPRRQGACAQGHDLPPVREAGSDHHLCAHARDGARPARGGERAPGSSLTGAGRGRGKGVVMRAAASAGACQPCSGA